MYRAPWHKISFKTVSRDIGAILHIKSLVSYNKNGETYYLLRHHDGCLIDGILDPGLTFYQNMIKIINEDWLVEPSVLYLGYLISNDGAVSTVVCLHSRIAEEHALLRQHVDVHWVPKSQLNIMSEMDQVFIDLSQHDKVRYCQLPNIFWGLEGPSSFNERVYFIAGPSSYNRRNLWLMMNEVSNDRTNIVIIDPINRQLYEEDRPWLETLEHWHLDRKDIITVFIVPKGSKPSITFDEMKRVLKKDNVFVFIQRGFEMMDAVPKELSIIWYDDEIEIVRRLL